MSERHQPRSFGRTSLILLAGFVLGAASVLAVRWLPKSVLIFSLLGGPTAMAPAAYLVKAQVVRVALPGSPPDEYQHRVEALLNRLPKAKWVNRGQQWATFLVESAGKDIWVYANWAVESDPHTGETSLVFVSRIARADSDPSRTQVDADRAAEVWRAWLQQALAHKDVQ